MTSREGTTARRIATTLAAALVAGCFPSFEVGSVGGGDASMDHSPRACADATEDCSGPDAHARRETGVDAAMDGSTCVPISVAPLPAHGGPACLADAAACHPGDVTKFSPSWVPPLRNAPHANGCTAKQIEDMNTNCFSPAATGSGCMAWEGDNIGCYRCVVTESTSSRYGPIIYFAGPTSLTIINFPACIALAEPCNLACAEAALADIECDLTACSPSSGSCDGASASDIQTCVSEADTTCGCAKYHTLQDCYLTLLKNPEAHPAASLCGLGVIDDFEASFVAIATYMCGPPS